MLSTWKGVPRLGVPAYNWGGECLHGLVHSGRATVFPQAIGLAATFDTELVQRIADAIASEARAKYHDPVWHAADGPRLGLNFWTPNINLFRDPRWGRGQETYGEDPYLTGAIGAALVRGLQGDHPRYWKVAACAKHFAVHSGPELLRAQFDARVSAKELAETYLPAFEALVREDVAFVMSAYNRVNGEPCSGSPALLQKTLRERWGFKGAVVSDAGAIDSFHRAHKVTKDKVASAVLALSAGCDMEIADKGCYSELDVAVERGLVSEGQIDTALSRVFSVLFKLGVFDDSKKVPFSRYRSDVIQSKEHIALARKAALHSAVLLKNDGVLPFSRKYQTIAVSGPNLGDVDVLLGNFYRGVSARLVTFLEGIVQAAPEGTVIKTLKGCNVERPNIFDSSWHLGLAETSDAVVAVIGVSPLMEGESGECISVATGGDRDTVLLPPHQIDFLRGLKRTNKPLVAVVTGGSPIAMPEVHELCDAVLWVGYPGEQGGAALGDILFGKENPSGRLPMTFPRSESQLPDFADYRMKGRTYRYMTEEPLYPFGFGLSFTRFSYGALKLSKKQVKQGKSLKAKVRVENAGKVSGEEVVQVYLTADGSPDPSPLWSLKAFTRVRLRPGRWATVEINVTPEMMSVVNEEGERVVRPGTYTLRIGGSSPGERSQELGAPKMAKASFSVL
ncbi:MAG TPA: glycoside hydrolase family 3 N-terminal domain-containing protein [Polyangiaceae bacterium]|nr:glycoside hydrolase family 3 N-terminal domain-containing protein [Polyangiaceae bacterium]